MFRFATVLCFVLLMCSSTADAQSLPNAYFNDTSHIACVVDSANTIAAWDYWQLYQTTDDAWDGPPDSTVCIDLVPTNLAEIGFNLAFIDPTRPVFLRLLADTAQPIALDTNRLTRLEYRIKPDAGIVMDTSGGCANDMCSGARIAIESPDAAGIGTEVNWYTASFGDNSSGDAPNTLSLCYVSEKIPGATVKEVVFKMKVANPFATGNISPEKAINEQFWEFTKLTQNQLEYYRINQFEFELTESFAYYYPFVVMHNTIGYPSENNIHYLELAPSPNTDTVSMVTVHLVAAGLFFQPHTELRGGLVNNDTVRHNYNLQLDSGQLCLGPEVEVRLAPGDQFTFIGGKVEFQGRMSCLRFEDGARLKVGSETRFEYGSHRRGMLAMLPGSSIELEDGAELSIQGTMAILEGTASDGSKASSIVLNRGNKLTFKPGSRLRAFGAQASKGHLDVYMRGGKIDLSGLPFMDRKNVNLIYEPAIELEPDYGFTIVNPVVDQISVAYHSSANTSATLRVIDLNGRPAIVQSQFLSEGDNNLRLDASTIPAGVYLLEVETNTSSSVKRFVKVE